MIRIALLAFGLMLPVTLSVSPRQAWAQTPPDDEQEDDATGDDAAEAPEATPPAGDDQAEQAAPPAAEEQADQPAAPAPQAPVAAEPAPAAPAPAAPAPVAAAPTAPPQDYVVYPNVRMDGFDPYPDPSLRRNEPNQADCASKCLTTAGCFMYRWDHSGNCWLQRPQVDNGWDIYAKHPHKGARPTYQVWPNLYLDSQGIENVAVGQIDECLDRCSRDDQCVWVIVRHKDPNNKDPNQKFECRVRALTRDDNTVVGVRMRAPLRDACTGANGFHCSQGLSYEGKITGCASCDWEEDSCGQFRMKCGLNTRAVGVRWTSDKCLPPNERELDQNLIPDAIENRPECERKVLCYKPEWESVKCSPTQDNYDNRQIGDAAFHETQLKQQENAAAKAAGDRPAADKPKKNSDKIGFGLRWSRTNCTDYDAKLADLSRYDQKKLEVSKIRALLKIKDCEATK